VRILQNKNSENIADNGSDLIFGENIEQTNATMCHGLVVTVQTRIPSALYLINRDTRARERLRLHILCDKRQQRTAGGQRTGQCETHPLGGDRVHLFIAAVFRILITAVLLLSLTTTSMRRRRRRLFAVLAHHVAHRVDVLFRERTARLGPLVAQDVHAPLNVDEAVFDELAVRQRRWAEMRVTISGET
jgi:hypothetical protein